MKLLQVRLGPRWEALAERVGPGWHDAVVSLFAKRAKLGIVRYRKEEILAVAELLERGEYRPVIDRMYPRNP